MKLPIHPLALAAVALLCFNAPPCLANTQVAIPLAGTLSSTHSILVANVTTPIENAQIYHYAISGACHGTGIFATALPAGSNLAQVLETWYPSPYPADVLNPSGKLPFTCFNSRIRFFLDPTVGNYFYIAHTQLRIGITSAGLCYASLENFGAARNLIVLPGGSSSTTSTFAEHASPAVAAPAQPNSIVIDSGQILISVTPLTSGSAQPTLSFIAPGHQLPGIRLTGTGADGHNHDPDLQRGKTVSFPFVLRNSGTAPDTFTLSATPVGQGFAQKFLLHGKDITAAVLSESSSTQSPQLSPGQTAQLVWQISDHTAAHGAIVTPVFTATSTSDPAKSDALTIVADRP